MNSIIKSIAELFVFGDNYCETENKSEIELAKEEYKNALDELDRAKRNFNDASQDYFEIANDELNIAIKKFEYTYARLKKLTGKVDAKVEKELVECDVEV